MIDTHAHLSERFKQEVDLNSLKWVVLSASSLQDSKDNLILAKDNSKLRPAVGIHPQEEIFNFQFSIFNLEELLKENKNIIAVGECGLEFKTNPSALRASPLDRGDLKKQEELFRGQIELAQRYNKPLIVHSREASDEIIEILKSYKNLRGVIHCYTGGKKRIKKFLEISPDWYFGIDGNLTYEVGLEQVVAEIPKDKLLLETDTPFLAPVPHRGETNRPEYIKYIYQKVSEIWEMSFEKTEEIIDENAERLFSLF